MMRARTSLLGLFRALTGDTRTFIRQEIQLAKTEISEKISKIGKNAAALAIGGFVAYAGLIVLLLALGVLLAWAFMAAGLEPLAAGSAGLGAIGLLTVAAGTILLLKGLKTISNESLAPERTLQTLQELKGSEAEGAKVQKAETEEKPSSHEMQKRVEATEDRLGETLDELGRRLSPQHINAQMKEHIRAKPYQTGLIAMVAGVFSGLLLRRKMRHSDAHAS